MKKSVVLLAVVLTACASSKYAVVPSNDVKGEIQVGGEKMVSIREDGKWLWHRAPEDVVLAVYKVAAEQGKQLEALKAQVAALQAAAPKPPDAGKTPSPGKAP